MEFKPKARDETSKLNAHKDYEINLQKAKTNIAKMIKVVPLGMNMTLGKDRDGQEAIIWLEFNPPKLCKTGKVAYPISLHQPTQTLCAEVTAKFNAMAQHAKSFMLFLSQEQEDTILDWKNGGQIVVLKPKA